MNKDANRNRLLVIFTIIVSVLFFQFYASKLKIFYGDALGYYLYLPATFIYHNLDHIDQLPKDKGLPTWYTDEMKGSSAAPNGNIVDQYTYGIALMEIPFFAIAHLYEKSKGLPADGYSKTYEFLIWLSSVFYSLAGMYFSFRFLRKFYSRSYALIGIIFIFLGTNLFWFTLKQSGMAHIPLFFLYSLLIYLVTEVYEKPKRGLFFLLGFIIGLITLIRPTDIICILIPLLYNVYNKQTFFEKIAFIKNHLYKIILSIVAFAMPIIPQLLYWKKLTGKYLYYSYGKQSFDWAHPKITEGLFSASNGWLFYSPIMIFSILGLLLYKRIRQWAWCLWVMFPLYIYIIYSWYCYYYINGFGSRPMIHLYPLLTIPFIGLIKYVFEKKLFAKIALIGLAVFFIAINISYSMQQSLDILETDASTAVYNMDILFKMHVGYNDLVTHDCEAIQPDTSKLVKVMDLGYKYFNDSASGHYVKDIITHKGYIYNTNDEEYSDGIKVKYNAQLFKGAKWLKCSGKFMYPNVPAYFRHLMVLSITHILWQKCSIENKIPFSDSSYHMPMTISQSDPNKWATVYFFAKIPKKIKDGDTIDLYIWSAGKERIYMDDLRIELYRQ